MLLGGGGCHAEPPLGYPQLTRVGQLSPALRVIKNEASDRFVCVFVNLLRFIHENSWPGPSRAASPAHLLPYRRLWLREHSSTYSAAGGGPADRDTHSFSSRGRPGEAGDEPEDPTQQLEGYGS